MAVEVRMPAYSESMEEADVVGWLVEPGDTVCEGDPIAEIETDKATGELEAPASGVLSQILIAEGSQNVKVGELLALIEPSESEADTQSEKEVEAPSAGGSSSEEEATPEAESASPPQAAAASLEVSQAAETAPASPTPPTARASRTSPTSTPATSATALARRLAERAGLDLSSISGSGASGRVLKSDVESHSSALANVASGHTQPRPADSGQLALPLQLRVDCRAERAQATCQQLSAPERPIPLLAVIIRAAAGALREVPAANRVWLSGELVEPGEVVVSLGLSGLDRGSDRASDPSSDPGPDRTRDSSLLPNADRMSLAVLAEQILSASPAAPPNTREAGAAALSIVDVAGAAIDSIQLAVSPPCVCVLGIGAPSERPVAIDGEVAVAQVITCTLTADSRALDAKSAARLLDAFKRRFEDPIEMILD